MSAFIRLLLFSATLLSVAPAHGQAGRFRWERSTDSVVLSENGQKVLAYQITTKDKEGRWPRANYVHPLYSLSGGEITEDFPEDHGHHRGIFWAWHQVIVDEQPIGDAWLCQDFEWVVSNVEQTTALEAAKLTSTIHWQSPVLVDDAGKAVSIAREEVEICAYATTENFRCIDFTISLLALLPNVRIGGSDDAKGYGGFSPRVALNRDQIFQGENGELEPIKTAIDAGPWVNLSDSSNGIAILCHPKNPVAGTKNGAKDNTQYQPWILRRSRSMQNAVYPGRAPVELSDAKPLVLKYRLVVHDGTLSRGRIAKIFEQYRSDS